MFAISHILILTLILLAVDVGTRSVCSGVIAGAVGTDGVSRRTPIEWEVVSDEQIGRPPQFREILDLESEMGEPHFTIEEIEGVVIDRASQKHGRALAQIGFAKSEMVDVKISDLFDGRKEVGNEAKLQRVDAALPGEGGDERVRGE